MTTSISPPLPGALCARAPARGRVLRLKRGYNPNSSSIGTIVFALPGALLAGTAAFGAVAGFVAGAFLGGRARPHGRSAERSGGAAPPGEGRER